MARSGATFGFNPRAREGRDTCHPINLD